MSRQVIVALMCCMGLSPAVVAGQQPESQRQDTATVGTRIDLRQAFRFARGAELTASGDEPVQLSRSLDFLVVADHSDGFGFFPLVFSQDPANATCTNTIGAPELLAVWRDPAFDPAQRAFYYVRVLEIPTPRRTTYDATRFGVTPLNGTRMTLVESTYTSPIWYTPP